MNDYIQTISKLPRSAGGAETRSTMSVARFLRNSLFSLLDTDNLKVRVHPTTRCTTGCKV